MRGWIQSRFPWPQLGAPLQRWPRQVRLRRWFSTASALVILHEVQQARIMAGRTIFARYDELTRRGWIARDPQWLLIHAVIDELCLFDRAVAVLHPKIMNDCFRIGVDDGEPVEIDRV